MNLAALLFVVKLTIIYPIPGKGFVYPKQKNTHTCRSEKQQFI
ncbi:hypothetical protein DES38_10739 [Streptohalobacillus salinus]|uniref:Uncharacterized protein n=1 Tax=Streptohalobacillus salinus TaxID=621096 RepID=A0A2V3W957_9BACI|nr:hypothetical protein DES38_10739 [Streptohalobacillus salinus]